MHDGVGKVGGSLSSGQWGERLCPRHIAALGRHARLVEHYGVVPRQSMVMPIPLRRLFVVRLPGVLRLAAVDPETKEHTDHHERRKNPGACNPEVPCHRNRYWSSIHHQGGSGHILSTLATMPFGLTRRTAGQTQSAREPRLPSLGTLGQCRPTRCGLAAVVYSPLVNTCQCAKRLKFFPRGCPVPVLLPRAQNSRHSERSEESRRRHPYRVKGEILPACARHADRRVGSAARSSPRRCPPRSQLGGSATPTRPQRCSRRRRRCCVPSPTV